MKKTSRTMSLGLALLGLLGTGVSALADSSSQSQGVLDPAGPNAQHISDLWYIVLVPALIVLVGVGGAMFYIAFKYRRKDENFVPKQVGGNNALEFTWTLIPAVILMFIFGLTMTQIGFLRNSPAPDAYHVKVIGQQWAWSFQYPNAGGKPLTSFGTLYIPAKSVVNLDLESKDVIHSWSVPRLAGMLNAVPGKHNQTWIEANEPGTYYGQCTEFCGLSHAAMTITVVAMSQSDYDRWYANLKHKQGGS